jgi:hypothetical protein
MSQWTLGNGYYDENGQWNRTKYCLVYCGASCDCGPPNGLNYSPEHDKHRVPCYADTGIHGCDCPPGDCAQKKPSAVDCTGKDSP